MTSRAAFTGWPFVLSAFALVASAAVSAQETRPQLKVALIDQWLAAVDAHEPGTFDRGVRTSVRWSRRETDYLAEHLPTVVSLIREPSLAVFFRSTGGRSPRQVVYSGRDLAALRALARRHGVGGEQCPTDPPGGPSQSGATDLLKRVAMFELDVSLVTELVPVRDGPRDSLRLTLEDGQARRETADAGHLSLARLALGMVRPPCGDRNLPAADDWVRRWYATSIAHQMAAMNFEVRHLDQALTLFRDDPELLFLGGAVHETLASPVFQRGLAGVAAPRREALGVRARGAELGEAADLFERSLRRAPSAETRLRLGNVWGLQGRHADAVRELTRTVTESGEDRLLAYYARLIHGRELQATGDLGAAARAFEQAGRLYPRAQTPHLALAHVALLGGLRTATATALARVVREPMPGAADADDPWWFYYSAVGLSFDRRARELWAGLPKARAR